MGGLLTSLSVDDSEHNIKHAYESAQKNNNNYFLMSSAQQMKYDCFEPPVLISLLEKYREESKLHTFQVWSCDIRTKKKRRRRNNLGKTLLHHSWKFIIGITLLMGFPA